MLERALLEYAKGDRPSGVMQVAVQHLNTERLLALAKYYAQARATTQFEHRQAQPAPMPVEAEPGLLRQGRRIAEHGIPSRRIPACGGCHGPGAVAPARTGDGHDEPQTWPHVTPRDEIPRLAGQYSRFLAAQLRLFVQGNARADEAYGPSYAKLMSPFAHRLQDDEIDAVSAWYASLPARPP